jgi:hypothetical protein
MMRAAYLVELARTAVMLGNEPTWARDEETETNIDENDASKENNQNEGDINVEDLGCEIRHQENK